jgi:hypothetical protein
MPRRRSAANVERITGAVDDAFHAACTERIQDTLVALVEAEAADGDA